MQPGNSELNLGSIETSFISMLDAMPVLISYVDKDEKYRYNNKAYETWFGKPRSAVYGNYLVDVVGEEAYSIIGPHAKKALSGERVTFEALIPYKSGELRYIQAIYIPNRIETGDVPGFYALVSDISDRKKSEEVLRFSATVSGSIADAVIGTDTDHHITIWNAAAEKLYGLKAADVIGKNARSVISTEFRVPDSYELWYEKVTSTGSWKGEVIQRTDNGKVLHVLASSATVKGLNNELIGFVTVNTDITTIKLAEEELKLRLRQQAVVTELGLVALSGRSIRELMNEAVSVLSDVLMAHYSNILELDESGEKFIMRAGIGWGHSIVFDNHTIDNVKDFPAGYTLQLNEPVIITDLKKESRFRGSELLLDHKVVSGMSCIIWKEENKPFGVIGVYTREPRTFSKDDVNFLQGIANVLALAIHRKKDENLQKDISERLEQMVKERTKELRRSNEDLQHFAYVASHDLKEPVRKIKTFANIMEIEYGDSIPTAGKIILEKIQNSTDRIRAMIDKVLDFSSLSASGQGIENVNIVKVIKNVCVDLDMLIKEKKAQVYTESIPEIEGASVLIYQLFYNLINNSLKFSRPDEPPEIRISSKPLKVNGRSCLRIHITDNGIGFDSEHAKMIFKTFTRLNSRDDFEGTGLGLALCKKVAERHGGKISATGESGKGAKFTVTLPFKQKSRFI